MASTTLGSRCFKAGETHLVVLVAILLSSTWLTTFDWIPLALELNLLWLSDDLLSWRRLNHQPGPWLASLSSLPIVWHIWKGDFYEWLERLHSERGSIVRIGPNRLSTSDANLVRQLDTKTFGSPRSKWYGAAVDPNPFHEQNVTTSLDVVCHEYRRKRMTSAYSKFEMEKSLNNTAKKHLTEVLEEHIDQADGSCAEVDLAQIIMRFAMQAFSNMGLGLVGGYEFCAKRTSLTCSLGPGRVGHSIYQSHCRPGSTRVYDDDHVSVDPNLCWGTLCLDQARSISCVW
ncbi:hypothetical protein E4T47_01031 [Aureobasidium subglaciale]|nr:hypothetical protein E4T47_01031 [Aureobasidium subglaciale]